MPSFPNAANGVKKIFKAEIMELISLILTVIATILGVFGASKASALNMTNPDLVSVGKASVLVLIAAIFAIAALVVAIIAFINHLIGLIRAKRDDSNYGTALICVIFNIAIEILFMIFSILMVSNPVASDIATVVSRIADIFSVFFILAGTSTLLAQRGDQAMAMKGVRSFDAIFAVYAASCLLRIVPIFTTASVVDTIFLCAYAVCAIVAYIMYLSFLGKAYKELSDDEQAPKPVAQE